MRIDLSALLAERGGGPWSVVANLPYNVATPLVLRALVEAPAVAHLLVMVQREVGERMAAAAGEEAYGAVSVRIAYFARAQVVGRVPASVFIPDHGSSRSWCASTGCPPRRWTRRSSPTSGWTPSSGPASASGARCSAARWPASSIPPRSSAPACAPTPGPRSSGWRSGGGWRHCDARHPVSEPSVRVLAPAKLTVSLRVTGVRADGYHELESEMVALSLADELVLTEGGSSGVTVVAEPGTRAEGSVTPRTT